MKKSLPKGQSAYIYDDQGANQVSEQIMDSYNSGVIDQEDGRFDTSKFLENEGEKGFE
jgi:hypothetical protein